jgi:hypothetical protein
MTYGHVARPKAAEGRAQSKTLREVRRPFRNRPSGDKKKRGQPLPSALWFELLT